MARGRMLNRVVAKDGRVAEYGDEYGALGLVFHHRLIAFLDVNGNVDADPFWLKGNVMPRVAGCSPDDIRGLTAGLAKHRLATRYTVDGNDYLHFSGFRSNQTGLRRDREKPEVPVPQGFDESAGHLPDNIRDVPDDVPRKVEVEVEVKDEVEVTASSADADASGWMHSTWAERFDGDRVTLTPTRQKKYRAMHREQLAAARDDRAGWSAVLDALAADDHMMSKRDYHLPESFLKNPERRDKWMVAARDHARRGPMGDGDARLMRRIQRMDSVDLERGAA